MVAVDKRVLMPEARGVKAVPVDQADILAAAGDVERVRLRIHAVGEQLKRVVFVAFERLEGTVRAGFCGHDPVKVCSITP